ncbi:hypothetical protein DMC64_20040 [Amycolatopsis sp. WAC 04197]|uniref:hypothetical protein n=1 Tax=Amycolatopsis sp. WAC 04197 TaxID=2203199 RepID=UPI000F7867D8|nr:hypothetical protein [Amycolatopsis sp. WAC 04197]RSN45135.1 hypothetical protein DMC64_20040 [Amycolatopsis sp. WAC 04197]
MTDRRVIWLFWLSVVLFLGWMSFGQFVSAKVPAVVANIVLLSGMGLNLVVAGAYVLLNRRLLKAQRTDTGFRSRLDEVREHVARARELMAELEDDVATRTAALEKLLEDSKYYENLATVNKTQAKAIEDMVSRQFRRQGRITTVQWWLSIVAAIVFGFVVNWASTPVWAWFTR